MRLIKRTTTLSQATGEAVPAEVIENGGQAYMVREGGSVLIEPDADLYALVTHREGERPAIQHLVVEPTYGCDLSCPFCFTAGQEDTFSLDALRRDLEPYAGKVVSISGGEPTLLENLPDIISVVNERNIPLLATNGIRLADRSYVHLLREAGLRHVTFSLNGFSERSLVGTNGIAHLGPKLKALENLEGAGMECLLSFLLKRGLNEGEIPALFEYAHAHPGLVREVRIRSTGSIGIFGKHEQFFTSEMLALLCQALGMEQEHILRELRLQKQLRGILPGIHFSMRSCGMGFHLVRTSHGFRPLGEDIIPHSGKAGVILNMHALGRMLSPLGRLLGLAPASRKHIWRHSADVLKVVVRSWPRPDALDLIDHSQLCGSRYLTGKKAGKAVCYANIMLDSGGRQ